MVRPSIKRLGNGQAEISFEVSFGQHKKFARGLYKIALSSIAYLQGPDRALQPKYDWVRDYVRHGGTRRHILLTAAADSRFTLASYPPWNSDSGEEAMEIRIGMAEFLLDLSPDEVQLPRLVEKARASFGDDNFSVLPAWENTVRRTR